MGFNVHAQQIKEKLKKAKKGDLEAQLSLAHDYSFGGPVGRNKKKAFRWYLCAAKQGSAKGQLNVGSGYLFGLGVKKNRRKRLNGFVGRRRRIMRWHMTKLRIVIKKGMAWSAIIKKRCDII